MREIDPIREPSEALLSAALHRLAKGSPSGAPEELGAGLARSFRQYHARRRRVRVAGWAALAACLTVGAVLGMKFTGRHDNPVTPNVAVQPQPVQAPSAADQVQQLVPQRGRKERNEITARVKASVDANQNDGFVPLPSYDPAVGTGDIQVVRLELSGADLRLVGAPVTEDLSDRRILTDVVVGRDGTPYAVRFVQ
ncbi:MAG TPA: hypothetical protein VJN64_17290 [Terriglobales bacterium]|nr:hypothetical protein [Terriglobales bacterium]